MVANEVGVMAGNDDSDVMYDHPLISALLAPGVACAGYRWIVGQNGSFVFSRGTRSSLAVVNKSGNQFVSSTGLSSKSFEGVVKILTEELSGQAAQAANEVIRRSISLTENLVDTSFVAMPDWCAEAIARVFSAHTKTEVLRCLGRYRGIKLISRRNLPYGSLIGIEGKGARAIIGDPEATLSRVNIEDAYKQGFGCQIKADGFSLGYRIQTGADERPGERHVQSIPISEIDLLKQSISTFVDQVITKIGLGGALLQA